MGLDKNIMTREEHAFENLIYAYARSDESSKDVFDKWRANDVNVTGFSDIPPLSTETINAIETCAVYLLNSIVCWDKQKLRELLELD